MSDSEGDNLPVQSEQLPPEVQAWLEKKGLNKLVRSIEIESYTSRPIPSPDEMEHYERINPGAANRLMRAFEDEQKHRHAIEDKSVDAAVAAEKRGQDYIFWLSILVIVSSTFIAFAGYPAWSLAVLFPGLSTLGYMLMNRRRSKPN